MNRALVLTLLLASCQPVLAGSLPLPGLAPRGNVQASDLIPVQPSGATSLMSATAAQIQQFALTDLRSFGAKGDGVTDDTAAIQTAISSGQKLYCSPGVYVVSASLLVESPNNDGQVITGGGSYGFPAGQQVPTEGAQACIIKPTAALTGGVFVIDGTPFPGGGPQASWVQGFGLENLTIDMSNMADVATNAAILQIQAWDGSYNRVRVINDGVNKRAYLAKTGAYTSSLKDFGGKIVDLEGTSPSFEVTTITLINADIDQFVSNYAQNVVFAGGSIQTPYSATMPLIYLPAGDPRTPSAFSNTAGIYMITMDTVTNANSWLFSGTDIEETGTYPSTCNDGTHGSAPCYAAVVMDATDTRMLFDDTFAGAALFDSRTLGDGNDSVDQRGYNLGGGAPADMVSTFATFRQGLAVSGGSALDCLTGWDASNSTVTCKLNATTGDETLFPQSAVDGLHVSSGGLMTFEALGYEAHMDNCKNFSVYSDNGSTTQAILGCINGTGPGGELQLLNPTTPGNKIALDAYNGTVTAPVAYFNSYDVGGVAGVSCAGTPTSSFAVTNGIVTHC